MVTLVNEMYPGASEHVKISVVADAPYKRVLIEDDSGEIFNIVQENLLIKLWARNKTLCSITSNIANPPIGFVLDTLRVQQVIVKKSNNDDEKKTYYTIEVLSYV